jgi:hypothetical protein
MGFLSFFRRSESKAETGIHRRHLDSAESSPQRNPGKKRGSLFLGICDMRMATIYLNALHIFSILLILLFQLFGWAAQGGYVAAGVGILLSALSIYGTVNFSYGFLFVTTIGLIGLTILYMSAIKIFCFLLGLLLLYAQCFLVYEMRRGIMTRERYEAGTEQFITEEGRVVVETTNRIAAEVVESSKCYGQVAMTSTQQAAGTIHQTSSRALEKYVAPVLGMTANTDDGSDSSQSSVVIVNDYAEA